MFLYYYRILKVIKTGPDVEPVKSPVQGSTEVRPVLIKYNLKFKNST
jgi:hypothetical protein